MKKYFLFGCVFLLAAWTILDFDFHLPADKFAHLKFSFLLFLLIFSIRLTFRRHLSEAVALILALRDVLAIGIVKELLDGAFGTGIPELADLAVDIAGMAVPFVGLIIMEFFEISYGSFVHDFSLKIHPNLRRILKTEKNYWRQQLAFIRHAGFKLIYQI